LLHCAGILPPHKSTLVSVTNLLQQLLADWPDKQQQQQEQQKQKQDQQQPNQDQQQQRDQQQAKQARHKQLPQQPTDQQVRNLIAALSISQGLLSLLGQLLKHMPSKQLNDFCQNQVPLLQPGAALAMAVLRVPVTLPGLDSCSSRARSLFEKLRAGAHVKAYHIGACVALPLMHTLQSSTREWWKEPHSKHEVQAVRALASEPVQQLLYVTLAVGVEKAAVAQGDQPAAKLHRRLRQQQLQQQQELGAVPQHHRQFFECLGLLAEDAARRQYWQEYVQATGVQHMVLGFVVAHVAAQSVQAWSCCMNSSSSSAVVLQNKCLLVATPGLPGQQLRQGRVCCWCCRCWS
jgi:hypothetical protein